VSLATNEVLQTMLKNSDMTFLKHFLGETEENQKKIVVWIPSLSVEVLNRNIKKYRGADKFLAWPTSRCILFDGENISFDASLVIYRMAHEKPARRLVDQRGRRSRILYRKLSKYRYQVLTG